MTLAGFGASERGTKRRVVLHRVELTLTLLQVPPERVPLTRTSYEADSLGRKVMSQKQRTS